MTDKRIGVGITGSFCSFDLLLTLLEELSTENQVTAILSYMSAQTDTRFYQAEDFRRKVTEITKRKPMYTIVEAEEIGPKKLFDVMLIAPCTGNTLAKLNYGITDTPVLMAAKAHLRNNRPLVLALATNDALGTAGMNIGSLLNRRNLYFVPFSQDDPEKKPRSMVSKFDICHKTMDYALVGQQIQPIII